MQLSAMTRPNIIERSIRKSQKIHRSENILHINFKVLKSKFRYFLIKIKIKTLKLAQDSNHLSFVMPIL